MAQDGSVEQQDSRGWTPIMWSSSNGYHKLVRQLIQKGADVTHVGQARTGNGTTTALHECAAMNGEKGQAPEGYYEAAWLLMAAGCSPFAERSDGMTAVEVAGACGNVTMKAFLEGCALFRGTISMPIPVTFGSKIKNRYTLVHPRFPFNNAAPTLWMTCFRNTSEVQAVCRIPIGNARVMIEGASDSSSGIIIIPSTTKVLKGVAIRSHTANSSIIEITAIGSPSVPGWKTLRTLADVCKAAGVAVSCQSLDQLCAAALRQAVKQMRIPGTNTTPELDTRVSSETKEPETPTSPQAGKGRMIADSAQEMTQPSTSLSSNASSQKPPDLPRNSNASQAPKRQSGVQKLFKAFRLSSSNKPPMYNAQLLDSSSSLGQASMSGVPEQKKGLFGFRKNSFKQAPPTASMPSISERAGAASPNIPDKFWSKMGRKMSNRLGPGTPASTRDTIESWFHEDDGAVSATGNLQKQNHGGSDLNDLMFPGNRPAAADGAASTPAGVDFRRQTTDGLAGKGPKSNSMAFILEEPIVPTQKMVPTGPRRSFSFDDLDDFVNGATRKARGHREGFADQMAPPQMQASQNANTPTAPRAKREIPFATDILRSRQNSMPRRSFSFHDIDQLAAEPAAPPAPPAPLEARTEPLPRQRSSIERDIEAWQTLRQQRSTDKKKGPSIDPNSHGGYQGAYAPEWRPYKPSPAPAPAPAKPGAPASQPAAVKLQPISVPPAQQLRPTSSKNLQVASPHALQGHKLQVQNPVPILKLQQPLQRAHSQARSSSQSNPQSPTLARRPSSNQQTLQGQHSGALPHQHSARKHSLQKQPSQPMSPAMQSAQRHAREAGQLQAGQLQGRLSGGHAKPAGHSHQPKAVPAAKPSRLSSQGQTKDKASLEQPKPLPQSLANLAALRALETGTLATGGSKSHDDRSGSVTNTRSQDSLPSDINLTSAASRALTESQSSAHGSSPSTPHHQRPVTAPVTQPVKPSADPTAVSQPSTTAGEARAEKVGATVEPPVGGEKSHVNDENKKSHANVENEKTHANGDNEKSHANAENGKSHATVENEKSHANVEKEKAGHDNSVQYESNGKPEKKLTESAGSTASTSHVGSGPQSQESSKTTSPTATSTTPQSYHLAVPSALLHGIKQPKFATPPKRIAPEQAVVPDIPEERSSQETSSTPERPSVGFGI